MVNRKWVVGLTAFLAVALLLTGFVAVAAETGSKEDPALSLGYLTEEFQPVIMAKIDEIVKLRTDEYVADMTNRMNQLSQQVSTGGGAFDTSSLVNDSEFIAAIAAEVLQEMPVVSGGGGTGSGGTQKVEIKNGKTLTCELGTKVVLRLGSATCVASGSPGLIDLTTGNDLANGKALEKNHEYLCTIKGRGFKATADVTVFIDGAYTIS